MKAADYSTICKRMKKIDIPLIKKELDDDITSCTGCYRNESIKQRRMDERKTGSS